MHRKPGAAEMRANPSSSSSSSSLAASTSTSPTDVESHLHATLNLSHWRILLNQASITQNVLQHTYSGHGTLESPYLVEFIPNDARNPMAYARSRKWFVLCVQAWAALAFMFASSAYSGGMSGIRDEFDVSGEVAVLGISMFVLGFAIGPLFWAPLSELYGRQKLFFISYLTLAIFDTAAAVAPNISSLIVLRFLAGAFGSSPLTNAGGIIADMFPASERGSATSIFVLAPFLGPALGPIVGGFLGESKGWRWVEGLMAIFTGALWILSTITYPETYVPVLLRKRATALSQQTGKVYVSKMDIGQPKKTIASQLAISLSRPWILLFKEPIVLIISTYMAIIYGTLYMFFPAFPIVFQQGRGWSDGIGGLAFTGVVIGMFLATVGTIFDNRRYARIAAASNGMAPPEARLPPAILGSVLIPIGLFWFAWTNGPEIHWIVPIVGSMFFAAGIVLVFLAQMNYLIDAYFIYAASALAANSVLRSLFGAAFPLFTAHMYHKLGNHWASSIPAFLALACLPFPALFYIYGGRIRQKCKYAAEAASILDKMRSTSDEAEKKKPESVNGAAGE